mmetsp:Transcript_23757/g.42640  ORF Transcript_23757/g.42640 Transcript_23757/m.42640 type:complete len:259 (-) Transcript_23757:789-1565(-)
MTTGPQHRHDPDQRPLFGRKMPVCVPQLSAHSGPSDHKSTSAARPRKAKKPTTSVTVVTNAPDANAGSMPTRSRITGMTVPASPATTIFTTMAAAITYPSAGEPNQITPTMPMTTAKIAPLIRPTRTSRRITRHTFAPVKSFVASARTATVSDWVPAFPPIDATMGIKTARATICAKAISNCAMTSDARIEVTRFTASHGMRRLVVSRTLSDRADSSPTPARRRMSSSCSSSKTAIASSMVIAPISRPSSSTTGAEIR